MSHGKETILVVDDAAEVRQFVRAALENLGYDVLEAGSALQALAVSRGAAQRIDLLVTDLVLRDSTGPDLARWLAETLPGLAILYLSGCAQDFVACGVSPHPGIEFLPKPFTFNLLARRVRDALKKRKRRVLIVGDDREVTVFARRVLGQAGFEVLEAADGKSAAAIVTSQSIDLVIADLCMPQRQGVETFLAVRRAQPAAPIIAVSGTFGGEFAKAALALGSQAALTKPFTTEKLLEAVRQVLYAEHGAPDARTPPGS